MMGIDNVMNLGEILNQIARRYPDAPGFIRNGREHSWKEISTRVDSVAAALRERGIKKGDRLLVHSRNNLPLFESAWIAFRLGAVWVPTNVRITPSEAAYLGSSSGAVAMLYDEGLEHYVDAVREALLTRDRKTIYRVDDGIPVLLAEEAIATAQIADFPSK